MQSASAQPAVRSLPPLPPRAAESEQNGQVLPGLLRGSGGCPGSPLLLASAKNAAFFIE